jgi:hypothetical protein
VHVLSLVASPSLATCLPGLQSDFATQTVVGLPSWSQVPALQGCLGLEPPAQ